MNTGVSTTFVPLGDTWMNCIILKGSTEWSCSFQHGHVDKRPESLNPPKISPFAYRKWRRQNSRSSLCPETGRRPSISKAIRPRWQSGDACSGPSCLTFEHSTRIPLSGSIGSCNQTAGRAGAAGLGDSWSQTLKCHPVPVSSAFFLPAADWLLRLSWGFVNQISLRAHIYH